MRLQVPWHAQVEDRGGNPSRVQLPAVLASQAGQANNARLQSEANLKVTASTSFQVVSDCSREWLRAWPDLLASVSSAPSYIVTNT